MTPIGQKRPLDGGQLGPNPNKIQRLHQITQQEQLQLNALTIIPAIFEETIPFNQYICPITRSPIRFPASDWRDPSIIYERAALERWVNFSGSSPQSTSYCPIQMTGQDIVSCPLIQRKIEEALLPLVIFSKLS